jgi:hypothetical protein
MHITCASPWKAVYLDRFALHVAFPRSLVRHDSHDYYRSSVANFLSKGRRSRVSSRWYVLATDVGHPLISLLDLIGHRPQRRGCIRREANLLHTVASISDVVSTGKSRPDWRLGWVDRWRVTQYILSTFPSVPRRTVLEPFDSHGSPVIHSECAFLTFSDDIQDRCSIPHLACFPF